MSQEIILRIGDTIEYSGGQKGKIEKIRIISSGKLIEQYVYDGKGDDLVLTLKNEQRIINLWVKDTPIRKIIEKEKKR